MRPLVTSVLNNFSFIMGIRLPDLPYFTGHPVFQTPSPASRGEAAGKNKIMSRILLVRLSRETRDAEPLKLHSGSGSGSGSGFFTGSGSGPAQQAKTNTTRLRLSTRCFPWGRALCTNWLHTGADLIQGIVSYVRIKTRTLKKILPHDINT